MKKRVVLMCVGLVALSLAACGGDGSQESGGESTGQTQESGAQGDEAQIGSDSGAEEDSTQGSPDQDGAQDSGTAGGDDSGINYEEGWSQEMEGLKSAVVGQLGDDYWPNMPLLPDMLEMSFGITSDMYDDYMAEMPMISANVDTLLIVRAKDDKVETVREALEAYRDVQINDAMQYPMNVGKVQASRIETIGNYVIFAQLGADTQEASEEGDEAVIAKCQEVNDSVIETIRGLLE